MLYAKKGFIIVGRDGSNHVLALNVKAFVIGSERDSEKVTSHATWFSTDEDCYLLRLLWKPPVHLEFLPVCAVVLSGVVTSEEKYQPSHVRNLCVKGSMIFQGLASFARLHRYRGRTQDFFLSCALSLYPTDPDFFRVWRFSPTNFLEAFRASPEWKRMEQLLPVKAASLLSLFRSDAVTLSRNLTTGWDMLLVHLHDQRQTSMDLRMMEHLVEQRKGVSRDAMIKTTNEAIKLGTSRSVLRRGTPRIVACAVECFIYFALWCNSLGLAWVGNKGLEQWNVFHEEALCAFQERVLKERAGDSDFPQECQTHLLGHPAPTTRRMYRDQRQSVDMYEDLFFGREKLGEECKEGVLCDLHMGAWNMRQCHSNSVFMKDPASVALMSCFVLGDHTQLLWTLPNLEYDRKLCLILLEQSMEQFGTLLTRVQTVGRRRKVQSSALTRCGYLTLVLRHFFPIMLTKAFNLVRITGAPES